MNAPLLRMKVSTYYALQKTRIIISNRVEALVRDELLTALESESLHDFLNQKVKTAEKAMAKEIANDMKGTPVYEHLIRYKGIGSILATGLIAHMQDPSRFNHASGLWAYAGLHVIDGKAAKRERGKKINWNPEFKTICWKVGESFVKTGKFYRGLYEKYREKYDLKEKEESTPIKGRAYERAKRLTVKIFLSHLLEWWRREEGLEIHKPYAHEHLGHVDIIPIPEEECM